MRLLGLSGSLRAASINTTLLHAASALASDGITIEISDHIRHLPLFNPDDEATPSRQVEAFRTALASADGVIIACPEYAHGVPGAFKNALDWVVASGEFVDKPFALFHANGRGQYARAEIAETLVTMNAHWVIDATLDLSISATTVDVQDIIGETHRVIAIRDALAKFSTAIEAARKLKSELGALPLPAIRPVFPI